jgi:hypothetical protein
MADPNLLSELRNHLVAQGIVRKPSVPGALPPLWLEPQLGVPAPGEGASTTEVGPTLVVGAFLTGGVPTVPYGSFIRKPIVDFQFRSKGLGSPSDIELVELSIAKAIIDKRDFMMGVMHVIECQQWRALQRIGSSAQGYDFVSSYWFELYRPGYGT